MDLLENVKRDWRLAVQSGDREEADRLKEKLLRMSEGFDPEVEGRPLRMPSTRPIGGKRKGKHGAH